MKKTISLALASLIAIGLSQPAAADSDDCPHVPTENWQSQQALLDHATQEGWTIYKVEKDDGCYEIEGVDQEKRYFELKLLPDSFEIFRAEFLPPLNG